MGGWSYQGVGCFVGTFLVSSHRIDCNQSNVIVAQASVIMVVMAYMLHITAASSYRGAGGTRADGK